MSLVRLLAAILVVAAGSTVAAAADAKKGQQNFIKYGCYGCHGYNGQGANTGPRLAPNPIPLEALMSFIRNAAPSLMPPYAAANLPDEDVADIHAWLASQPKNDWKSIPLLKE